MAPRRMLIGWLVAIAAAKSFTHFVAAEEHWPLWNAARAACLGDIDSYSALYPNIGLETPVRVWRKKSIGIVAVPDKECPQPSRSVVFLIGRNVGGGKAYFYLTSPRGTLIRALVTIYVEGKETQFERVDNIRPEISDAFNQLVKDLTHEHGSVPAG